MTSFKFALALLSTLLLLQAISSAACFVRTFHGYSHRARIMTRSRPSPHIITSTGPLKMAVVSEKDAKAGIDKVVKAIQKDSAANQELGRLVKVTNVLGYGSPSKGTLAVRFNASFQKAGMGRSSVPLPFGLGQSNVSEGRGSMVGQVKASIDEKTGKVTSCSVFRDLGYGRAFNLKV